MAQHGKTTIGDINFDYVTSACFDNDGNYLIARYTNSFGFGQKDVFLMSLNAEGASDWGKIYGSGFNDASSGRGKFYNF